MAEEGINDKLLTAHDWNGAGQFSIPQTDYDAVTEIISNFITGKTADELMQRAVKYRILLAPVATVDQILHFEHLRARGFYTRLHDDVRGFSADLPAIWSRFTHTPLAALVRAPTIGEHTAEILAEITERA